MSVVQDVIGREEDPGMVAGLSILSVGAHGSRAEVVGDITRDNVEWLAGHLRDLEGDVVLDLRGSRFTDRDAELFLEEYRRELDERGNRLAVRGWSADA